MNKVSITRLSEYAQKVKSQKSQDVTIRPDSVRLQLLNIELTRETAEWMLADLDKRRKRLEQSVNDAKTREAKREKRERELNFVAYASDIINYGLKHPISK